MSAIIPGCMKTLALDRSVEPLNGERSHLQSRETCLILWCARTKNPLVILTTLTALNVSFQHQSCRSEADIGRIAGEFI